ncbi:MAG TPA: S-methyl-5'-thioinosine phosphorylase [Gammaproteobacteria bacterium]|nr:S-methyl-5'-thioinosine phosphorylase [Gammaproteobacteria bacterium]
MTDTLGLIVGSGFDALGLEVVARSPTKTPYGEPSSPVLTVRIGERRIACIARHGERHAIAPHEINYRANLWALHERGVRTCIGVNAVGAIAAGFGPGDLAVPDQLIDYTYGRAATFGGEGAVGRETAPASAALPPSMAVVHAEFTEPFDGALRGRLAEAVAACGYGARGGTYGVTQGPRLETAAEINRLERDGCAMVGMTAMPEAVLARELGWAYAICAVAVNYAAGRSPAGTPIMTEIAASLAAGMVRVAEVLRRVTSSPSPDAM